MNIKSIVKSKRMKYGSLSLLLIAAFVSIIIALNLILSSIASKTNLTIDLTDQKLYSVGEESKAILETLGEDLDITIYFLSARDLFEAKNEDEVMSFPRMVRDLGEQYTQIFPNKIKVEYKDISRDPAFVEEFLDETQTALSANHVIVKGKYHHRVLSLNAFFSMSEETKKVFAFNGEQRFTAAMLQCSISEPQVVTFTTGHSETVSNTLFGIFSAAGFETQAKDLSREEIDKRTRFLIISNPKEDFQGYTGTNAGAINEIDKVQNFMKEYNNLLVFVDSSTPELPHLQEYLLNYWGLGYKAHHKVKDTTHAVGTIADDGYSIVGQYVNFDSGSAAYNIHSVASSTGGGAKTVFRNAVEIYSDIDEAENNVIIENVMETYDTAERLYTNEDQEMITDKGVYPLMLLSAYMNYGENNVKLYQYVMLVSSTDFASDTFLSTEFGNRKLIFGAARVMGVERVVPDIEYKAFIDNAMKIELGAANTLAWMVSAIFPLIIIIIGLVVFVKRRHL